MDSCWSVSVSFDLPLLSSAAVDPELSDDVLAMTVETQRDEAMAYNYGLPMPDTDVGGAAPCESSETTVSTAELEQPMLSVLLGGTGAR